MLGSITCWEVTCLDQTKTPMDVALVGISNVALTMGIARPYRQYIIRTYLVNLRINPQQTTVEVVTQVGRL